MQVDIGRLRGVFVRVCEFMIPYGCLSCIGRCNVSACGMSRVRYFLQVRVKILFCPRRQDQDQCYFWNTQTETKQRAEANNTEAVSVEATVEASMILIRREALARRAGR